MVPAQQRDVGARAVRRPVTEGRLLMSAQDEVEEGPRHPGERSVWEQPQLTVIGRVRDLVRGETKSGPNADADPFHTRKTGVG